MIDEQKEVELAELIRDAVNSFKGDVTYYQVIGILTGLIYDLMTKAEEVDECEDDEDDE